MRIVGTYSFTLPVVTLGDLRLAIRELDAAHVSDDMDVDISYSPTDGKTALYVYTPDEVSGELIECGDHSPPVSHFDVVLSAHPCDGPGEERDDGER
jgi:hypothetical protein